MVVGVQVKKFSILRLSLFSGYVQKEELEIAKMMIVYSLLLLMLFLRLQHESCITEFQ